MNPLLAQLDRKLKQRGEPIYLRRQVNAGPVNTYVQIRMLAIVRALTVEQLIGNIAQQSFFVIMSPTEIYRQQWPGGTTPAPTGSIIAPSDPRLPRTSDILVLRGQQRTIQRVAPVFDRGECVRLEINVGA